jgi:hypothetical protein
MRFKGTDNAVKGTDSAVKGTDNAVKGTDRWRRFRSAQSSAKTTSGTTRSSRRHVCLSTSALGPGPPHPCHICARTCPLACSPEHRAAAPATSLGRVCAAPVLRRISPRVGSIRMSPCNFVGECLPFAPIDSWPILSLSEGPRKRDVLRHVRGVRPLPTRTRTHSQRGHTPAAHTSPATQKRTGHARRMG